MTLTTRPPLSLPSGWPRAAWVSDPGDEPRQLTHAVWPGHRVALCGLLTTVTGGAWPSDGAPWLLPRMRCPLCARAIAREIDSS